jgi:hypothetical protein
MLSAQHNKGPDIDWSEWDRLFGSEVATPPVTLVWKNSASSLPLLRSDRKRGGRKYGAHRRNSGMYIHYTISQDTTMARETCEREKLVAIKDRRKVLPRKASRTPKDSRDLASTLPEAVT